MGLRIFTDIDASRILKIPLAKFQHEDFLVWKGVASGILLFGVCTALYYITLRALIIQPTRQCM